jgi:hypothetical protein
MIRLRGILELLASHGSGEIRSAELEAALDRDGREVRSALRSEGIVREGPRAETVPCDGIGCAREVRELPRDDDGRRRVYARSGGVRGGQRERGRDRATGSVA